MKEIAFVIFPLASAIRKASYDNAPLSVTINVAEIETIHEQTQKERRTRIVLKSGRTIDVERHFEEVMEFLGTVI